MAVCILLLLTCIPHRMRLQRAWGVRVLACCLIIFLHTSLPLEADRLSISPCRLILFISHAKPPSTAKTLIPIRALKLSNGGAARVYHQYKNSLPFLSPKNPFLLPFTFLTHPLTRPRAETFVLLAQLSFLRAPETAHVCDEDYSEINGKAFQKPNNALSHIYVESNARYLRLSPIKTRRVLQELRGKTLAGALAHLAASPRRPALPIFKAIESAIANAAHLHGNEKLRPQLVSITANNGPVMKRPFFKARGRVNIWRRPTTHIKVIIKAF